MPLREYFLSQGLVLFAASFYTSSIGTACNVICVSSMDTQFLYEDWYRGKRSSALDKYHRLQNTMLRHRWQEPTCTICQESFADLKENNTNIAELTSCQHVVCEACLKAWTNSRKRMECPSCHAVSEFGLIFDGVEIPADKPPSEIPVDE